MPLFVNVVLVANVPLIVPVNVEAKVTGLLAVIDAPLLTVKVSNEIALLPLIVFPDPVNVYICVPVLLVSVPLLVKLPANVIAPVCVVE